MVKLLIEVECCAATCGPECPMAGETHLISWPKKRVWMMCQQFQNRLRRFGGLTKGAKYPDRIFYRCPACLAAEREGTKGKEKQ